MDIHRSNLPPPKQTPGWPLRDASRDYSSGLHTLPGGRVVPDHDREPTRAAILARGRRCASLSFVLAGLLGLHEADRAAVSIAAMVADIGMIFLPEGLASHGGTARPVERHIVEAHVRASHDLLLQYALREGHDLSREAAIVLGHHERYDGRGYPARLVGRDIPEGARVLAITSAFIDISDGRDFPSCSRSEALELMTPDAGRRFDPHYFAIFEKIIRQRMDLLFTEFARMLGPTSRVASVAHGVLAAGASLLEADRSFLA